MRWRQALALFAGAACTALTAGAVMTGPAAAATAATAGTAAVRADGASLPFGHWGPAQPIPGLAMLNAGGSAQVLHVSCVSLGNCTAAGTYQDSAGNTQVFTANEVSGTWGQATPLTGLSSLNVGGDASATALSCSGLGTCAIGGFYTDGQNGSQPFVGDSQGGTFGPPQALFAASALHNQQIATVSALSCASPGNCTVAVTLPVFPPGGTPSPSRSWPPRWPAPGPRSKAYSASPARSCPPRSTHCPAGYRGTALPAGFTEAPPEPCTRS